MAPVSHTTAPARQNVRRPGFSWERRWWNGGLERVAGVDEVGRGCLFGPVVAAAVILDRRSPVRGLHDSKQLDPEARERLSAEIRAKAVAWSLAAVDAAIIDRINIYQAARAAMEAAVGGLCPGAQAVLADAMRLNSRLPQKALIHGDATSRSIAAASILAKVERDRWMQHWDAVYPEYGLASHKGYATPDHLAALRRLGPTPLHRHSFRPVAERCWFAHVALPAAPLQKPLLYHPAS